MVNTRSRPYKCFTVSGKDLVHFMDVVFQLVAKPWPRKKFVSSIGHHYY